MCGCAEQRDIKPQNLLLNPKTHEVKLCDFGSAKCFAAGTRVRLYSGGLAVVEDIRGGELLMGDDGQPRVVTAGSLARGRAVMYRITPQWEGAEAFTVNGSHILVLINSSRPAVTQAEEGWRVHWFELDSGSNVMTRQSSPPYHTEAEAASQARQLATVSPAAIEWEVSVDDFLQAEESVRNACQLFQSGPVSFASSHHSSLQTVLSSVLGLPASPPQIHWAAWFLGLCAADDSTAPAPHPLPPHLLSRLRGLHSTLRSASSLSASLQPVSPPAHSTWAPTAPRDVCSTPTASVFRHRSERVPHAWLCDSLDVRRPASSLASSTCSCSRKAEAGSFTATVQHHSTAAGFKELAGSLGIRCSAISKTHQPITQSSRAASASASQACCRPSCSTARSHSSSRTVRSL